MDIPQDVITHNIIPLLDIEELYQLRNTYPRAFNEAVNSSMKTLPGATKVLQLALVNENQHLLDFVINNLFVYGDNYININEHQISLDVGLYSDEYTKLNEQGRDNNYGHVFDYASGSGDTSEDAVWDSRLALEDIFFDALREGNVELVADMLGNVTSPTYDAWIDDLDIFGSLVSGTLEAITILTSAEVMSTLNPSLYGTYGRLFEPLLTPSGRGCDCGRECVCEHEYVDYHVKAIERLYAALGYIPEAVKRAAIGRLNMNDEQFIDYIHEFAIEAHKEMQANEDREIARGIAREKARIDGTYTGHRRIWT